MFLGYTGLTFSIPVQCTNFFNVLIYIVRVRLRFCVSRSIDRRYKFSHKYIYIYFFYKFRTSDTRLLVSAVKSMKIIYYNVCWYYQIGHLWFVWPVRLECVLRSRSFWNERPNNTACSSFPIGYNIIEVCIHSMYVFTLFYVNAILADRVGDKFDRPGAHMRRDHNANITIKTYIFSIYGNAS